MATKTVTIEVPDLEYALLKGRAESEGTIEDLVLDAVRRVYGIPFEDEELDSETVGGLRAACSERARGETVSWDQVKREDGIES